MFGRVVFLVREGVVSIVGIIGSRGLFALEIDEDLVLAVAASVLSRDSWSSVPCFPFHPITRQGYSVSPMLQIPMF